MLDIPCKWNHTICGLLCLGSFTQYILRFIYVVACISTFFPFYGQMIKHENRQHFFIQSLADRHLDSFHFVVVTKHHCCEHSCTSIQASVQGHIFSFLLGVDLRSGTAKSYGNSMFHVWETSKLSKVAASFYSPTASVWGLQSLYLTNTCLCLLILAIRVGMMWFLTLLLICAFLVTNDIEHFHVFWLHLDIFFSRNAYSYHLSSF